MKHKLLRLAAIFIMLLTMQLCAVTVLADSVGYYDAEGYKLCENYQTLPTGSETTVGTEGETTWYVLNSSFSANRLEPVHINDICRFSSGFCRSTRHKFARILSYSENFNAVGGKIRRKDARIGFM